MLGEWNLYETCSGLCVTAGCDTSSADTMSIHAVNYRLLLYHTYVVCFQRITEDFESSVEGHMRTHLFSTDPLSASGLS